MPSLSHALLFVCALLAAPQDPGSWSERRDEVRGLDFRAADDATLEELLVDLGAVAGPADPFASFAAGRSAFVLAERLRNRGEYARAAEVNAEGRAACGEPGGMAPYLQIQAASLALYAQDYTAAGAFLEQAEADLEEADGATALPATIWSLRAQVQLHLGLPDQAAPLVARALERARSLRGTPQFDSGTLIDALTKRANLLMATEAYDVMLVELPEVLADAELMAASPTARARFVLRLGLAHLWFARGDDEHARLGREYLAEALDEPGTQASDRLTAHMRLAQLALLEGDVAGARDALQRARALQQSLVVEGGAGFPPLEAGFLAALEMRCERLDPSPEARRLECRARLRAAYDGILEAWRARPERDGGVGFMRYASAQLIVAEVIECELAEAPGEAGRLAALTALARASSVGSLATALGAGEPTPDEIRALLPPAGGLLVFAPSPDASHVFALDAAGSLHLRLGDARDLRELCRAYERLVRQSPAGLEPAARARRATDLERAAAELSSALFPPELAARLAGWDELCLVADDLAGGVALESVPLAGRALCLSKALGHLPGLAVGAALLRREPLPAWQRHFDFDLCLLTQVRAGAAAERLAPGLAELPVDEDWIETWTRPFVPARVERLTGERATLEALVAAPAARVLQILTHGLRDPARERSSGLLLTADAQSPGLLFDADVARLQAPALAVLSACGAGRGPERIGDAGASDLSGSFLLAGSDCVILAASELAFEPVAVLDGHLHRALARGQSPARALRSARRELVEREGFGDPFHYLGILRAVGLAHRPLFEPVGPLEPDPQPRRLLFGLLISAAFVLPIALVVARWRRRPRA